MHWSRTTCVEINKALVTWGMLAQIKKGNVQMCNKNTNHSKVNKKTLSDSMHG